MRRVSKGRNYHARCGNRLSRGKTRGSGWYPRLPAATVGGEQRNKNGRPVVYRKVSMDLLRIIIAIVLPPLGVFLQVGIGKHFWINIVLTLLGFIPGIIHAVWVIAKY